ncbi:MAG: DUF4091 domain-containing protein [Armatimonadetes bacterium]|nr:DUF4091 domain-containing protein [Armatimonadota bacterium]
MEAIQLVVYSRDRSLHNCQLAGERLAGPGEAFLAAPEVSVVGSFLTGKPGTYPVDYDGWHADVLLPPAPVDIPAGDFQAFWVRIRAPRDQPPGTYRGEVRIRAGSEVTIAFPLAVTVWPFALPERPSLDNALSFDEGQVAAVYGKPDREMVRRYAEFLLRNRIEFTSIYRKTPPDLELLAELHHNVRPFRFNILGLNRYMAEISPQESEPHVSFVLSQLRNVVPELDKRGLLKYAYLYGFDELPPSRAQDIARIAGAIHGEFPELPILTTAADPAYGADGVLSEAIAAFCPGVASYDLERADLARAKGKKVWWYFCQGAYLPNINWYLQYPLIDVRMLFGTMAARYRPDGVLYWSINSWTNGGLARPLEGGPLFPDIAPGWKGDHGEGLLVYPGPDGPLSSVRLENVRDGLEDFEYYTLLRQRVQALAEMKQFSDPGAAPLLQSARRLMAVRPHLVADKTRFSRDPATLRAERERIASTIVALGELLRAE